MEEPGRLTTHRQALRRHPSKPPFEATLMRLRFLGPRGEPLAEAVVSVTASPGPHTDIGMITDAQGRLDLAVDTAGPWAFSVFHDGRARTAQATLAPGQAQTDVQLS